MNYLIYLAFTLFLLFLSCNTYTQGERIYQAQCANCHGMEGQGLASLYPALTNSEIIKHNIGDLPCIILKGKFTLDSAGNKISEMPPIPKMEDVEITNLINYMQKQFGVNTISVRLDSIISWRSRCK